MLTDPNNNPEIVSQIVSPDTISTSTKAKAVSGAIKKVSVKASPKSTGKKPKGLGKKLMKGQDLKKVGLPTQGEHLQFDSAGDPIKKKFKELLSLPLDKLHEINDMIFKDGTIKLVAAKLQDDFGLYKTTKPDTLRQYLTQYKAEFKDTWHQFHLGKTMHVKEPLPAELKEFIPKSAGDPVLMQWIPYGRIKILLKEAMTKFDALTEMERVTLLQYERCIKIMEYEAKMPTESKDKDGNIKYLLGVTDMGGRELALLHNMFKTLLTLQMDLGIRTRIEAPSNHLHVDLQPQHQKLLKDFDDMKKVTDVTAQAMEVLQNARKSFNPPETNEMPSQRGPVEAYMDEPNDDLDMISTL